MAVTFYNEDTKFKFNKKLNTKQWIKLVAETEGCIVGDIQLVFCSDKYILETNNSYLSHNYYTDIITFDYCEIKGEQKVLMGDLIISVDTVTSNAVEYGVSAENELQRVIIHGVLHLIGYPDKQPDEAKVMREKEDKYLELYYTKIEK